jgi:Ca2+-binding RTX toxin-like protein
MANVQHFVHSFFGNPPGTVFTQPLGQALGVLNLQLVLNEDANGFDIGSTFNGETDIRAEVDGTGLTYADGVLTGGTITAFRSFQPNLVLITSGPLQTLEVTGLSLAATTFQEVFGALSGATTVLNAMLAGRDTVNGSAGRDDVLGLGGNDLLRGQGGSDAVFGGDGADSLLGGGGGDSLIGGRGDDRLSGGTGNDTLQGNQGRDVFVFDTDLGASNIDRMIGTYRKSADSIELDRDVFDGIGGLGRLDDDAFVLGRRAVDEEDRIIYDKRPGLFEARLLYDADGVGGETAQVFLTIGSVFGRFASLDASEFLIV